MIGKTVSHFRIVEELGEGGMGMVYKARDLKLGRFVALKILPEHLSEDENKKKRFIREAKSASTLEHPNICTVYESGELPGGQMFLAIAFCEGELLRERLNRSRLKFEEAVDIARQVASGMAAAHESGIVHRDIKPENIIILDSGLVKILDFGVAKMAGSTVLTMEGSRVGTIAYMSPEQAAGKVADFRADVFSLGIVLYEMLTGVHPFHAEHELAMMYNIMNEDPLPLSDYVSGLPENFQKLIDGALEKDREERIGSMKEFIAGLDSELPANSDLQETIPEVKPKEVKKAGIDSQIGPYRLLERIGIGGMGEVWTAEQDKPFHRKVALKILKAGMDTEEIVARFEAERQAMAIMNHPYIAKVYDAGSTPRGRPYIAMEYIKGIPIDQYCDRHLLGIEERLKLFIRLCEGVQHAHHKAVIHRDLKPNNVLITVVDDIPIPKIIDFGVAKATAQRLTEKTMYTHLGQLIGTPEYMSPEQAELTGEDIDTRTDVYSLGVILYQILSGSLPFDSEELRKAGFEGIRHMIREVEPMTPSTKVTSIRDRSDSTEENRPADYQKLSSRLKGDLDWIIMKAIEKDRTRRYASVSDLAADIERHLKNEPVLASPPSNIYRIKKFIRRHRAGVVAASFVILALIMGIAGTTIGMIRAMNAEKAAREEAETSERVSRFLEELFEVSDPGEARGNSVTAREILDKGSQRIFSGLKDQPLIKARLMCTMGRVYRRLGLYNESLPLSEQALEIRREKLGVEDLKVADSKEELGRLLSSLGDFEKALPLLKSAMEIRKRELGPEHPKVGQAASNLGNVFRMMRQYDKAVPLYKRALAIREGALGPNHPDVSNSLNGLAIVYEGMKDYRSAEPLYKRALRIREKAYGRDHPEVATSLNNLATLYWNMGQYRTAQPYNNRALKIQERILGPDHPDLAHTLNTAANLYQAIGNFQKTRSVHLRALKIRKKHLRPDHPRIQESYYNLACVSSILGEKEAAVNYLREAVDRGFKDPYIFEDSDLQPLRGISEFESLIDRVRLALDGVK